MGQCFCDKGDRIIDVGCEYESGEFFLRGLPQCLPRLFTARFRAPADYAAGDVVVVLDDKLEVMTSRMEPAAEDLFKTGAVVRCDIDLDHGLAFFVQGGVEVAPEPDPEPCKCVEYQTGNINHYIDPAGDDSPNNPGTADSPFKTLAGARNAVSQRVVFTSMGQLRYNFNSGTYELSADDSAVMRLSTHPYEVVFRASDPDSRPLLVANNFIASKGQRTYENLRLAVTGTNYAGASRNAALIMKGIEVIARSSKARLVYAYSGGTVYFEQSLILDGGGYAADVAFGCDSACLALHGGVTLPVTIKNLPSVTTFTHCLRAGSIFLHNAMFSGTTTGKRYLANLGGTISTGNAGANYFPGTVAGTTETGGQYL